MVKFDRIHKKVSGRAQGKYRGLEQKMLVTEAFEALDDYAMVYEEAPSPCVYNTIGKSASLSARAEKRQLYKQFVKQREEDARLERERIQ